MESELEVTPDRILALAQKIIAERQSLDYMTVAKAMVLQAAYTKGRGKAAVLADSLGISKQTRFNWLNRKLLEWVEEWEQRMLARAPERPPPPPKKRMTRITEDEWQWIRQVLSGSKLRLTWEMRRQIIQGEAGKQPIYGHLRSISKATLWKNRSRLIEMGKIHSVRL